LFSHFLVERGILPYELLHKKIRIKPEELLPRAIPAQDIKSLLSVIGEIRARALILLLLRTGMRIGELLNVKISDIRQSERKILLYQGSKNYLGRAVYFNEDAEEALKRWLKIRNPQKTFLFYSRSRETISYVAAWSVMRKALDAAGLSDKDYSLHCLRHTFATDMLNAGLRLEVLQQLLGHQSAEITRGVMHACPIPREKLNTSRQWPQLKVEDRMNLIESIPSYKRYLRRKNLSVHTLKNYLHRLQLFAIWAALPRSKGSS